MAFIEFYIDTILRKQLQFKMTKLYLTVIVTIVATFACDCSFARADTAGASASASASVGVGAAEGVPQEHPIALAEPEDQLLMDSILLFSQSFRNEVQLHPQLFDAADVEVLLSDPHSVYATQFLNQRSGDWRRAFKLAVQTLQWRADMNLNQLQAHMFPCDLFSLGLIFEHGYTHHRDETGAYVAGNPVIWIRLGALGSVIKQLEKFTGKRLASFAFSTAHTVASSARVLKDRIIHPHRRPLPPPPLPLGVTPPPKRHENLSVKNERTITHVLKSIAWWLEDWQRSHAPGSQATLVLDFESTDFALSSTSISDFLVKLDDHFPDLFDQIIGYRYKYKIKSLHSPLGLLNKIFTSRVKSSPETDRKMKFVNHEPDISAYMPRVDVSGNSMLPDYISGRESLCVGPTHAPPAGCQTQLDGSSNLYDPLLWQAVHNEFYQVCKPQNRV